MNFIGKRLLGAAQELRRLMDDNLKRHNLTAPQIHVLGYLNYKDRSNEPCIQRDICAACGDLRASSVTSLLKTLEEAGYIYREQGSNAREKRVALTERGRSISCDCRQYIQRAEEELTAGFSQEEIEQFVSYLQRAKDNLERFSKGDKS